MGSICDMSEYYRYELTAPDVTELHEKTERMLRSARPFAVDGREYSQPKMCRMLWHAIQGVKIEEEEHFC